MLKGDGNCLFRALGDQLDGRVQEHLTHREAVVRYMRHHRWVVLPLVQRSSIYLQRWLWALCGGWHKLWRPPLKPVWARHFWWQWCNCGLGSFASMHCCHSPAEQATLAGNLLKWCLSCERWVGLSINLRGESPPTIISLLIRHNFYCKSGTTTSIGLPVQILRDKKSFAATSCAMNFSIVAFYKPRSYATKLWLAHLLTGVKYRATSVAKNHIFSIILEAFHPLYEAKISNHSPSVVYGSIT